MATVTRPSCDGCGSPVEFLPGATTGKCGSCGAVLLREGGAVSGGTQAVAEPATAPKPLGWRKRHPVLARVVLYGAFAAVLGGGLWWGLRYREASAQQGLMTRLQGLNDSGVVIAAPAETLKVVREEVLPKATDDDVIRRAHLLEAAALDGLERYDEADAVYRAVAEALPAGIPMGAVYVPWANMRISAGKPTDALKLLDTPGATAGWPTEGNVGVLAIRARAQRVLEGKEPPKGPGKALPK